MSDGSILGQTGSRRRATRSQGKESIEERIIDAAYRCFERYGIAKTTIEDIARDAGVSRPTVYKYYPGKEAILDHIATQETVKVNVEVRRRLVRKDDFAELLTEALLLVIRVADRNPYIRRMVESHEFQIAALSRSSAMQKLQREWWGRMLAHAAERGELASDLDIDEVILWLSHSQSMLMTQVENPDVDDAFLRRLIRRFIVEPLLEARGRPRL